MPSLGAVLIGCQNGVRMQLHEELLRNAIRVDSEYSGVTSASETFRLPGNEKRIFVIQLQLEADVQELRQLRAAYPEQPILSLIGEDAGQSVFRSANRAGANQIVFLPLQSEDFSEAIQSISVQYGSPKTSDSQIIAVSGVTGGAGATTVAVNLAWELAHTHNISSILAELQLGQGMLGTYLDLDPRFTTHDLLTATEKLDSHLLQQALTPVSEKLHVLASPHRFIAPGEVISKDVFRLLDLTREAASLVVLDVPNAYDNLFFNTLSQAEHVILVAEQKVPSIRSMKMLNDVISRQSPGQIRHLVVNRYNPKMQGFAKHDVEKLLGVSAVATVANDWNAVMSAVNHGRPLRKEAPNSRVLTDIGELARSIIVHSDEAPTEQSRPGLFGQLARALGRT